MEIYIERGQEFKKGGFLSGKNVKLTIEVTLVLSAEEKQLIEKYYEPSISTTAARGGRDYVRTYYDGTDESFKVVKVDRVESNLSNFSLTAHVDDGRRYLGNIHEFEKAVVRALVRNADYLKGLSEWQGKRTLTSEEALTSEKAISAEEIAVSGEN
jgi:hypothetical protein